MTRVISSLLIATLIVSSYSLTRRTKQVLEPEVEVVPIVEVQQTPKVSSYMGQTYNPFIANPLSKVDPGFTGKQIFEFTDSTKTTKDGNFALPNEVVEVNTFSLIQPEANSYTGLNAYYNDLLESITFTGGMAKSELYFFTQSADYQANYKAVYDNLKIVSLVKFKCSLYSLAIKKFQKLTKTFRDAVDKAYQNNDWDNFVNTWGVYYTTQVTFGALAVQRNEFARNDALDLKSIGYGLADISASFLNDFEPVTSSLAKSAVPAKLSFFLGKVSKSVTSYTIGSAPDTKSASDWIAKASKNPAPVSYQLAYIGDLFSKQYLGQYYSSKELSAMKTTYENAVKRLFLSNGNWVPNTDPSYDATNVLISHSITFGTTSSGTFADKIVGTVYHRASAVIIKHDGNRVISLRVELDDGYEKITTPQQGASSSGSEVRWNIPSGRRISSVFVRDDPKANRIGLQFTLDDGTKSDVYGLKSGYETQTIPIEGHLVGFKGRAGGNLDAIGFISKVFSYDGNSYATYATEFFGGEGGTSFSWISDKYVAADKVVVRSGSRVDAINLFVGGSSSGRKGGNGGSENTLALGDNLCGIKVREGDLVDKIQFCVNGKWSSYGGNGGTEYTYTIPNDSSAKLVGIYGKSGDSLDRLGFIFRVKG